MGTAFISLPGAYDGFSITPRNIWTNFATAIYKSVPGSYIINGYLSRDPGSTATSGNVSTFLRTGLLMGKVTSGGLYRPSVIGVLPGTASSAATSLLLQPAVATYVQTLITNGGTASNFIITSPTTSAGTVVSTTVSATSAVTGASATSSYMILSSSLNSATVVGGIVQGADGSGVPLTVLADNDFGIDISTIYGNTTNQYMQSYYIGGDLIGTQVINLVADDFGVAVDTSVTAYLQGKLQLNGQQFTFASNR